MRILLTLLLLAPAVARADDRPVPPGVAPSITPALAAQTRARIEAEDRPKITPEAWQAGIAEVDLGRHGAWLQRAEEARPPHTRVLTPLWELYGGARVGMISGCKCGLYGVETGVAFRAGPYATFELPVGLLHGVDIGSPSWSMISARPAFSVSRVDKSSILFLRGGPDLLVPVDTPRPMPKAFVGGFVGLGGIVYFAPIGDGGYVGMSFELAFSLRGPIDPVAGALDTVGLGGDVSMGLKVAF